MSQSVLLLLVLVATTFMLKGGRATNILTAGDALFQNQYLNNSNYFLVLQNDCNLVLYNNSAFSSSQAVWNTNSAGQGNNSCTLQVDTGGFLSIYNASTFNGLSDCYNKTADAQCVPWSGQNYATGFGGQFFLMLGGDGTLQVYDFQNDSPKVTFSIYTNGSANNGTGLYQNDVTPGLSGSPPNSSPTPPSSLSVYGPYWDFVRRQEPLEVSYMPRGYSLSEGSSLVSGNFSLTLAENCYLRCSNTANNKTIWDVSASGNYQHCVLTLQQDGNLQLQTNDSHQVVKDVNNAQGRIDVNWVLYLDHIFGFAYVNDILDPTNILSVSPNSPKHSRTTLWISIGVVGGVLLIIIIVLTIWLCYAHPGGMDPIEKELQKRLQKKGGKCQALTLSTIKHATNNFERKLGGGGFGEVFYGKLANGQEIAVKTLSASSHQNKQEFFNEIELLSMVHHKYLVSLIGYCLAPNNPMLVYEYMSGGDLRNRLHGESVIYKPLTWRQRTTIILQVAEGIEYLHDKCSPAIIHRDIKTTNILLTSSVVAKVADFGLSKLRAMEEGDASHITTVVKGTPGYVDPEYHQSGMLTDKSDVYAFGIVMMEILTAQNHFAITRRVSEAWKTKQLNGLADPNLNGNFDKQEFSDLVKLSLWCVEMVSIDRPSMPQVVQALRDYGINQTESQDYYGHEIDIEHNLVPNIQAKEYAKFATRLSPVKDPSRPLFSSSTCNSSSNIQGSTVEGRFSHQSARNGEPLPLDSSSSNPRMIEISEIFSTVAPR